MKIQLNNPLKIGDIQVDSDDPNGLLLLFITTGISRVRRYSFAHQIHAEVSPEIAKSLQKQVEELLKFTIKEQHMAPVVPFPRPLFPPSHDKGPVTNGDDIVAVKRAISRAGYFKWQKFDDAYNETFAMEGVKEFQKHAGLIATGNYGQATHDALRSTRSKGKPDEWAFDKIAIDLMTATKKELTKANTNLELKKAREVLAFCRLFDGGLSLWWRA